MEIFTTMRWLQAILVIFLMFLPFHTLNASTLDDIRSRGQLICGVNAGLPGFAEKGASDQWRGFDVDFCRAVSTAIFSDPLKITYVPLTAEERFDALKAGKVDLLSRNSTWTMTRDINLELEFVGVIYYDGQGFMVRKAQGLISALELGGVKICLISGTTTDPNVRAYFKAQKIETEIITFNSRAELLVAYDAGKCDAYASDRSALAADRVKLKNPDELIILPEVISKEPLGPVVLEGDSQWVDLVRWTLFALINAEEIGWTSDHEKNSKAENGPEREALTKAAIAVAQKLKLKDDWVADVIGKVGNYSEIFDKNLGEGSPLRLSRGLNALWNKGGILYAPPMR